MCMRDYINIASLLSEAPISSIEYDNRDGEGSFTDYDKKLIQSPKFHNKLIKSFGRTPYNIKLVFYPNPKIVHTRDDDDVDSIAVRYRAGVHDDYEGILGSKNEITLVLCSNLSPDIDIEPEEDETPPQVNITDRRIPLTPWIIAHKMGHALQDNRMKNDNKDVDNYVRNIDDCIGSLVELHNKEEGLRRSIFNYGYNADLSFLTFRSARNSLNNHFEVFPEIIAQFLIQGRVITNGYNDTSELRDLNNSIKECFDYLVGKVLVEF